MKAKKWKWLTSLLAVGMVLAMLPHTAFAEETVTYGIRVMDFSVTSANAGDVLGDQDTGATVTYDAASNTLILNNAALDDTAKTRDCIYVTQDLNIKLIGGNTIKTNVNGIAVLNGADLSIEAEDGASLAIALTGDSIYQANRFAICAPAMYSFDADGNAIPQEPYPSLTINGGTFTLTSGGNAGNSDNMIYAGGDITICGGAKVTVNQDSDTMGNAIWSNHGSIAVSDDGTEVNAESAYYCVLFGSTGVTISGGAKVSGSSQYDSAVFSASGGITISDAEVSLAAPTNGCAALFANTDGSLTITNSTLEVSSGGASLFSMKAITIAGSEVSAASTNDNAIKSRANSDGISITDSIVNAESPEGKEGIKVAGTGTVTVDGSWVSTSGSEAFENSITDSVLINGTAGQVIGAATVPGDVAIPEGTTVTIPEGASLTVPEGVTLTKAGMIEGEESLINNGTVDCQNHQPVKVASNAATCTEAGNTEYWICSVCGKLFSDENGTAETTADAVTIAAAGHSYGTEWKSDETNHWHECTCGEKSDAAAHTLDWVIDKEATAAEAGSKHQECTVCGYQSAAVEIPAAGSTGDVPSPPTGDSGSLALWLTLMAVSALGAAVLCGRKRKAAR